MAKLLKLEHEPATAWAYENRQPREDLNPLEFEGFKRFTAWAIDELADLGAFIFSHFKKYLNSGSAGGFFLSGPSCYAGGWLWFMTESEPMAENYTLKTGERLRGACVVGLAVLLVFQDKETGREVVYRVTY